MAELNVGKVAKVTATAKIRPPRPPEFSLNMLSASLAAIAILAHILPSLSEVRRAPQSSEVAHDVRNGLLVGSAMLIGVGTMISLSEQRKEPVLIMAGVAVLLALAYEGTLRHRPTTQVTAEPGPSGPRSLGRYGL
jgi:hypothetical protein